MGWYTSFDEKTLALHQLRLSENFFRYNDAALQTFRELTSRETNRLFVTFINFFLIFMLTVLQLAGKYMHYVNNSLFYYYIKMECRNRTYR